MKFKKHILKLSILAAVLVCVIVAGSLFALGAETPSQAEPLNLTVVTTPLENGSFTVTAKIAEPNSVSAYKIAGLEVTLNYPDSVTAGEVISKVEGSYYKSSTADGKVKYVCIKEDFDSSAGYATLGELFTVTFSTTQNVDPAYLFDSSSIDCLIGNVNAIEVTANVVYAGDLEALANAVIKKSLEFVISGKDTNRLVIAIAPTPAIDKKPTNKTGEIIKDGDGENAKEAIVVVKGDLDRDGVVSVFDATMIKNGTTEGTIEGVAADLGADDNTKHALDYILGYESNIIKEAE